MKRLTTEELKNLTNVSDYKLLNMLERWSDRKYLIGIQNDNGINHKSLADPDVQKLHDDYDAIEVEVKVRFSEKGINVLNIGTLLDLTNQIALDGAIKAQALGIPSTGLSESELEQVKDDYNNVRGSIEFNLGT